MIELSKVSKRYESGKTHQDVFRDLSFKFEETGICQQVFRFRETTLLNLISGLDKFNKGSLKIFGKEISSLNQEQLSSFKKKLFWFCLPISSPSLKISTFLIIAWYQWQIQIRMPLKKYLKIYISQDVQTNTPQPYQVGKSSAHRLQRALCKQPRICYLMSLREI